MALANSAPPAPPKFILVSDIGWTRITKYPTVRIQLTECNYLFLGKGVVSAAQDLDEDGKFETLTLTLTSMAPVTTVVGHLLSDIQSNTLGTITESTVTEIAPPVAMSPGQYEVTVTLGAGLATDPTGTTLAIVDRMPVGTTAYEPVPGGRTWSITLYGANPQAMGLVSNMLGTVMVSAASAVVGALNAAGKTDLSLVTQADIVAAVQGLAAQGTNIDGLMAQQGESLEAQRAAGTLPCASVMGNPA